MNATPKNRGRLAASSTMLGMWVIGLHLACWWSSIRAQTYSRGPLEKGEYVATFVEDVQFPHFATGTYFTFLYTSYENGKTARRSIRES